MANFKIWKERWQSMKTIIEGMEKGETPSTIKSLLTSLGSFGESQVQFFLKGFEEGWLYPSTLYSPDYVMRTTLDQISYDISAYQQALDQYRRKTPAIVKAEQLSQLALGPAIKSGLLQASTSLAYFNKSPLVRTIPYAPLALVGVPFTCTAVPRDFLATPHEIGHHVYRQSPGLRPELRQHLPVQPAWCSRWQEEVFADIYGCFIAGPVIGLDFQDILLDNDLDSFISDDGHHPIDAIRPFAYSRVLADMGYTNAAKALKKRWQASLNARNNPQRLILEGGFESIGIKEARAELEKLTRQIYHYLSQKRGLKPKAAWSDDIELGEKIEILYTKFEAWANNLSPIDVPEIVEDGDEIGVMVNGRLTNKRRKGETQTWIDQVKKLAPTGLPRAVWVPILAGDGWAVNGPEEDPTNP